jgi:hypothetical protein
MEAKNRRQEPSLRNHTSIGHQTLTYAGFFALIVEFCTQKAVRFWPQSTLTPLFSTKSSVRSL